MMTESVHIAGFDFDNKERRDKLYHEWCLSGGKLSYSRAKFDQEVYEKGIDLIEKQLQEKR